jgi:hypothetical protein
LGTALGDFVLGQNLWFSSVFGILTRLWEIRVKLLDTWVLVSMTELAPHTGVPVLLRVVLLEGTLTTILISMCIHE